MTARVVRGPAIAPCGSCPYRCDVPSGVWAAEEYEKLPPFDRPTGEQPLEVFLCHQQNGRLCAGWVGCHDMTESLGLRLALASGVVTVETAEQAMDYRSSVPLFESGAAAAEHGLRDVPAPSEDAIRVARRLHRKTAESVTP